MSLAAASLAGAAAVASFAFAPLPRPAIAAASQAPAWTVAEKDSYLGFESAQDGEAVLGQFHGWVAQIAFDPANLAGSHVTVSVDTNRITTGDEERDEAIAGSLWFAAKAFPRAVFTASSFRNLGGGRYQAVGELTVRGISRPVALPFALAIEGNRASMTAEVVVDRTLFSVGQGVWSAPDTVPFEAKVKVKLAAMRAG
jgi:polyisoprenoid-binding protein YceI